MSNRMQKNKSYQIIAEAFQNGPGAAARKFGISTKRVYQICSDPSHLSTVFLFHEMLTPENKVKDFKELRRLFYICGAANFNKKSKVKRH